MQTVCPAPPSPPAPLPRSDRRPEERRPPHADLTADPPLRYGMASLQQWLDLNA